MSSQSDAARVAAVRGPADRPRLRHQARDGLAAAAVSLAGSFVTTLVIAALVRWLG